MTNTHNDTEAPPVTPGFELPRLTRRQYALTLGRLGLWSIGTGVARWWCLFVLAQLLGGFLTLPVGIVWTGYACHRKAKPELLQLRFNRGDAILLWLNMCFWSGFIALQITGGTAELYNRFAPSVPGLVRGAIFLAGLITYQLIHWRNQRTQAALTRKIALAVHNDLLKGYHHPYFTAHRTRGGWVLRDAGDSIRVFFLNSAPLGWQTVSRFVEFGLRAGTVDQSNYDRSFESGTSMTAAGINGVLVEHDYWLAANLAAREDTPMEDAPPTDQARADQAPVVPELNLSFEVPPLTRLQVVTTVGSLLLRSLVDGAVWFLLAHTLGLALGLTMLPAIAISIAVGIRALFRMGLERLQLRFAPIVLVGLALVTVGVAVVGGAVLLRLTEPAVKWLVDNTAAWLTFAITSVAASLGWWVYFRVRRTAQHNRNVAWRVNDKLIRSLGRSQGRPIRQHIRGGWVIIAGKKHVRIFFMKEDPTSWYMCSSWPALQPLAGPIGPGTAGLSAAATEIGRWIPILTPSVTDETRSPGEDPATTS